MRLVRPPTKGKGGGNKVSGGLILAFFTWAVIDYMAELSLFSALPVSLRIFERVI